MDKTQQKMHTVDRTYHCAKCNKIFFKEVSLLAHQCTGRAQFEKKAAAKSLQKTSSYDTDKKYKCSKCDASFASSQSRNAHMRMHVEGTRSNTVCSARYIAHNSSRTFNNIYIHTLCIS